MSEARHSQRAFYLLAGVGKIAKTVRDLPAQETQSAGVVRIVLVERVRRHSRGDGQVRDLVKFVDEVQLRGCRDVDAMTRAADVDIVFLDTPGRNGAEFEAALRACDFGLVVARPTIFDIPGARETVRFLRHLETRHAVVLNQVHLHAGRADEIRAIFEKVGYPTTPYVRSLVAHQDAAAKGMGVTELCPLAPAATEVRELWAHVKDKLATLWSSDA